MLTEDLKSRFKNLDPILVDTYLPTYEGIYKAYYNAEYGQNSRDDEIILNLLAHLITIADTQQSGDSIKQVSGESVGGVSVSYAVIPLGNDDKFFSSTIYGQTFKLLISANNGSIFV